MKRKRWKILEGLLRNYDCSRQGAEIGVFEGDTTSYLLEKFPELHLLCVDPFKHYPDQTKTLNPNKDKFYRADFNGVKRTFLERMKSYGSRVTLTSTDSITAAYFVPDRSLDFVFIDANHSYEYVKNDILTWLPKVRLGGLLTGHDYRIKGYKNSFGVTRAVREIFGDLYSSERYVWYHQISGLSPCYTGALRGTL